MLVITRRPGESVFIGAAIELHIVAVDARDRDTRCAISIIDANGDEVALVCSSRPDGVAVVRTPAVAALANVGSRLRRGDD